MRVFTIIGDGGNRAAGHAATVVNEKVCVWTKGVWAPAYAPYAGALGFAGSDFAGSFGNAVQLRFGGTVGLVHQMDDQRGVANGAHSAVTAVQQSSIISASVENADAEALRLARMEHWCGACILRDYTDAARLQADITSLRANMQSAHNVHGDVPIIVCGKKPDGFNDIAVDFVANEAGAAADGKTACELGAECAALWIELSEQCKARSGIKNVYLVGDSIRLGYGPFVDELFEGRAEVYQPEVNCAWAGYTLNFMVKHQWLHFLPDHIDVIHWNNGIWDMNARHEEDGPFTPLAEYTATLRKLVRTLRKITPHVIFATNTPPKNDHFISPVYGRCLLSRETTERYNAAAREVMADCGVEVNDLYALVFPHRDTWISDDNTHLTETGYRACAASIVEKVSAHF